MRWLKLLIVKFQGWLGQRKLIPWFLHACLQSRQVHRSLVEPIILGGSFFRIDCLYEISQWWLLNSLSGNLGLRILLRFWNLLHLRLDHNFFFHHLLLSWNKVKILLNIALLLFFVPLLRAISTFKLLSVCFQQFRNLTGFVIFVLDSSVFRGFFFHLFEVLERVLEKESIPVMVSVLESMRWVLSCLGVEIPDFGYHCLRVLCRYLVPYLLSLVQFILMSYSRWVILLKLLFGFFDRVLFAFGELLQKVIMLVSVVLIRFDTVRNGPHFFGHCTLQYLFTDVFPFAVLPAESLRRPDSRVHWLSPGSVLHHWIPERGLVKFGTRFKVFLEFLLAILGVLSYLLQLYLLLLDQSLQRHYDL